MKHHHRRRACMCRITVTLPRCKVSSIYRAAPKTTGVLLWGVFTRCISSTLVGQDQQCNTQKRKKLPLPWKKKAETGVAYEIIRRICCSHYLCRTKKMEIVDSQETYLRSPLAPPRTALLQSSQLVRKRLQEQLQLWAITCRSYPLRENIVSCLSFLGSLYILHIRRIFNSSRNTPRLEVTSQLGVSVRNASMIY